LASLLLLWTPPVTLLLLSPRQPLLARHLVQRTAPLLQEDGAKSESAESSKGELVPTEVVATGETRILTAADTEEVGNLVEDEEWLGLGTEMFIVLRSALRESIKKNTREFTGKDEYQLGDLSKEADARIKDEVAKLRGKDEYEIGDLSVAIDSMVKEEVCKLTGKDDYVAGDLSVEIDARVKAAAAAYAGKETYEPGDLSREIGIRAKSKALEFTGKDNYSFGDVTVELNKRRAEWVTGYLGKEYEFGDLTTKMVRDFTGNTEYKFGDITKAAVSKFTGKDEYEFGDVSKKLGQMLFGNKQVPKKKKDE
jgi:hypothetical protein